MVLSTLAIAVSVVIFVLLLAYLRDMISLTVKVRAFANLALIIGLGLAELAFMFLIGAYFNACEARGKLIISFLSTAAILAGICALVIFLRYILLFRILEEKVSIETIKTVPMPHTVPFIISIAASSACISIRPFSHTN